jgi:hypothetical protein
MANRRKEEPETNGKGKGRIKFRYTDQERTLDFTMENVTGDSVTEGLRSLANALAGRTLAIDPSRRLPKKAAGAATEVVDHKDEEETLEQDAIPAEEVEETTEEETEAVDDTAKPRRVVKLKAPKLLGTPKLTDAKVPLADFMKKKNPDAMLDKYAVVAVWYKEQFQINEICIDHIFTAFKHLGIESQLPTDLSKPLKNLTYNRKWFDAGKDKGTYAINWLGESEVGKMGAAKTP